MTGNTDQYPQQKSREEIERELRTIEPDVEYYAITLVGTPDGQILWSAYTHWVGWVDDRPGQEIRQASIVRAERMAETWIDLGESYLVVNNPTSLLLYFRFGGNALVKKEIAEKHLDYMLAPQASTFDGPWGFKSTSNMPDHVFKQAPRPNQRMRILQRDSYRCRICGRRPDDYTDIELHLHHIRPWSSGGLTEDDNLITLCDTCHDGLKPHEEHSLFSLIAPEKWDFSTGLSRRAYLEGVRYYREAAKNKFSELEDSQSSDP